MPGARTGESLTSSGAVIGGRYAIQARLGEGAHAITYRAHDQRLKRTVAIKVLRSHLSGDTELVSRFVREAELAASISHPNVVDVYDVGTDGDVSYIVMRLVPGQDLKHIIQEQGRLPVVEASPLVQQILRGLGAIHAAGIVHRDVKPQNILITPDGTAQVTDFGVAYAALAEGLTTQGMTVGTASYMAPEQARGEPVSQATDIYAVGVVFYEMLTGRVPFTGENPMTVMLAHLQSRPAPPSQAVPGLQIPPRVEQIILRAMAKEPAQRFPSTAAMAAALSGTPMPSGVDQATTVTGAAAARPPMMIGGDQTILRNSVGGYGQALPPQPPAIPPWLDAGGRGGGPPPPTMALTGSGGRGRGWAVALFAVLFGLLAVGAVAAATQFGPFDRGGGADGNGQAGLAFATGQPTATRELDQQPAATTIAATSTSEPEAATVAPTEPPSTATTAPRPTATTAPPPTATTMPPPTATATVPAPTATSPPTATATVPPATATATVTVPPPTQTAPPPTAPPPTETPAIVQTNPTADAGEIDNNGPGNSGNGNGNSGRGNNGNGNRNGNGNGNNGSGSQLLSSSGSSGSSITVAPSDWMGAYTNLNTDFYGQDCVALYGQGSGYDSASLTFSLDGVPANGLTLTLSGIDDEYDQTNPLAFSVNGQRLTSEQGNESFPQWDASVPANFAQLVANLPAAAFVDGENTITISNLAPNGQVNVGPYLLLGEGTLELT